MKSRRLRKVMNTQFHTVHARMQHDNVPMRTAAYAVALDRLGESLSAGGNRDFFAAR